MDKCQVPGCSAPTTRGVCDQCDKWVEQQVASFSLKPCPFCGDSAQLAQTIDASWWVFCQNDECKGNVGYFDTREEALLAWGFRQPLHNNMKPGASA